ncbi:MAG: 3-dehydroquinate synthase [Clostridia bacterium]|nr:3-dehydroquinate synthase [Clostridia bacterium]
MEIVKLSLKDKNSYPILIGNGLLKDCGKLISDIVPVSRVFLITDENVAPLYLERVKESLENSGFKVFSKVVKAGEQSKSIKVLGEVLEDMAKAHITRADLAISLGGGVVGDLTGFAAGCYLRGIKFIQIPTTLLAAVDASVGGKTAVNLEQGKNLAGLFYQPQAVICDTDTLMTLKNEQIQDGAAEAIKTAILADEKLFEIYEKKDAKEYYEEIIIRCVKYKAKIVSEDPTEKGVRKLLNLGHTAAHSIELLSDFKISHGHAVAIGTAIITTAAYKRGLVTEDVLNRIIYTLKRNDLPVSTSFTAKQLAKIAENDKKAAAEFITVIMPRKIGKCSMDKILLSELEALLSDGMES